ncbi:sulfatase family protein [Erythrobacter rubeus]|uniref:Sulfatase-like hydrolase/transferase n=1 Tax=Erythrobacter rubeus TaxID=2760803 RepID=A0ABR8KPT4_9SPHN|nr:sulfatase-like hydrolase/transferase [Erythrobacter rubeus]MBD2841889.1 sulfatase-like hydrolase/transferase [Erythrobacter rubeus]
MSGRPNILLIMTDQHRADHTGFGGNRVVQTPHLDGLAARGTVFDKAYVANPICMPNRASIMTGLMPSAHGSTMNGISLDWGARTFARSAREAGYRTALIGKSHLQIMNDVPEATRRVLGDDPLEDGMAASWPEGWDALEDMDAWRAGEVEVPSDFYGFDHVGLTIFHSDLCSGHYYRWLLDKGVDPETLQGPKVARESGFETQQVWHTSTPEELYPTTYVAEEACAFLDTQRESDDPFLLKVSFPDPHHPFTPPGKYWDMYSPEDIELPATFFDDHAKSPSFIRLLASERGDGAHLMMPFSPTEAQFKRMAAAEYGMITMIDDAVGIILGKLEEMGVADDTIVIFTSDHGDMFGDHGLMLKVGMHYEGCIRVPLVVAGPGIAAGRTDALASSTDIAATIMAMTGNRPSYNMTGRDLTPILADHDARVRDSILIEEEHIFPDPTIGAPINLRSLVTGNARLTVRYGNAGDGELYQTDQDPDELHNRFGDKDHAALRQEMTNALNQAMIEAARTVRKPKAQA